jgi:hypothetical protein
MLHTALRENLEKLCNTCGSSAGIQGDSTATLNVLDASTTAKATFTTTTTATAGAAIVC